MRNIWTLRYTYRNIEIDRERERENELEREIMRWRENEWVIKGCTWERERERERERITKKREKMSENLGE